MMNTTAIIVAATIVIFLSSSEAQQPFRRVSKAAKSQVTTSKASKKSSKEQSAIFDVYVEFSLSMSSAVSTNNDPSNSPTLHPQGLFGSVHVNNPIVLEPEYARQNSPQHSAKYDAGQAFDKDGSGPGGNPMFLPMTVIVVSFLVILGTTATTLRVLRGAIDCNDSSEYEKDSTAAISSPRITCAENIVDDRVIWRPWGQYLDTIREEMTYDSDYFDEQSI